jgi:hypothetical protein
MSLLSKLRRLAAMLHYARARRAYLQGRIDDALLHHEKVLRWTSRPLDRAFHATLLILAHRSNDARALFGDIIEEVQEDQNSGQDRRYLLNYCRYYAALIDGVESEDFRTAAQSSTTDRSIFRLLPLPPEPVAP